MTAKTTFTYARAILYGVITELTLVLTQFLYLKFYVRKNPDISFAFSSEYMMSRGFYIFQILGFFVYSIVIFILIRRIKVEALTKVLTVIVAGAVVELTFYAFAQADYEMAYFFSILDKFIAAVFGSVVYYYSTDRE